MPRLNKSILNFIVSVTLWPKVWIRWWTLNNQAYGYFLCNLTFIVGNFVILCQINYLIVWLFRKTLFWGGCYKLFQIIWQWTLVVKQSYTNLCLLCYWLCLGNEGNGWLIPYSWKTVYGPPPDMSIF